MKGGVAVAASSRNTGGPREVKIECEKTTPSDRLRENGNTFICNHAKMIANRSGSGESLHSTRATLNAKISFGKVSDLQYFE